ncbi:MAG: septal ring lytic transglycosylase RlpA family protein [Erythrobacter sp.]
MKHRETTPTAPARFLRGLGVGVCALLVPLAFASASANADAAAEGFVSAVSQMGSNSAEDEDSFSARAIAGGSASYYAAKFHGRPTASGERFDNSALTAAHRSLPFGSLVRVINPANGKSVTVRINDRGPFTKGRVIDVSRAAAEEIGLVARGHARVELELIEG